MDTIGIERYIQQPGIGCAVGALRDGWRPVMRYRRPDGGGRQESGREGRACVRNGEARKAVAAF